MARLLDKHFPSFPMDKEEREKKHRAMYALEIAGQIIFNDGQDLWSYNKEIMEVTVSTFDEDEQDDD